MNGVHDMGGMHGFGAVTPEKNEPVFHANWERRMFALANLIFQMGGINIDEFRHAIERIPPDQYLASSYYQRWLAAAETLMVEHGLITREELIARQDPSLAGDVDRIARPVVTVGPPPVRDKSSSKEPPARFAKGDPVRARNINPLGHTRLPRYARSKRGVIARDYGVFVFPDTNAHHAGEKRQHCYSVAFGARELWGPTAPSRERLFIDLWEDYLELIPVKIDAVKAKVRSRAKVKPR
jgi:nitrile hydratase beta subunit